MHMREQPAKKKRFSGGNAQGQPCPGKLPSFTMLKGNSTFFIANISNCCSLLYRKIRLECRPAERATIQKYDLKRNLPCYGKPWR